MADYLKVVYSEKERPYTNYPDKLARHLFEKFGLKPGEKILDLGCGRGEFLRGFSKLGLQAEGLDGCASARDMNKDYRIEIADLEGRLPYPDNSFDMVYHKSLIEHLHDPANLMSESYRILKEGGKVLILTPDWQSQFKNFYEDPTHYRPYTRLAIEDLLNESVTLRVAIFEPEIE